MANKRQKLAGMEQRKKEPEDNTNEMKQLGDGMNVNAYELSEEDAEFSEIINPRIRVGRDYKNHSNIEDHQDWTEEELEDLKEWEKDVVIDNDCDENNTKHPKFSWGALLAVVPHDFKGVALISIAILACTISTILTMKFVSEVRGDAGYITLGLGAMWELSKYTFGAIAILHTAKNMRFVLGLTTLVLIGGSTAASLGYLTEMNDFVETNTMIESVEYQDLAMERNVLQRQIDTLLLSSKEDTKRSFRDRGLKTNDKVEDLREKYRGFGEDMSKLKEDKVQLNTFDALASIIISLMLEICGILAISLFAQNKEEAF